MRYTGGTHFLAAVAAALLLPGLTTASVGLTNPPSASNVLVLQTTGTGAGTTPTLSEFGTASAGAAVQTAAVVGCTLGTGPSSSFGSMSADGGFGLFPCYGTATTGRDIVRIAPNGTFILKPSYTAAATTYLPRGAASVDGMTGFYGADGDALYYGANGGALSTTISGVEYYYAAMVTFSLNGGAATLLTTGCASGTVPCPTGSVYYNKPALPTSAPTSANLAIPGISVPAISTLVATYTGAAYVLYVGSNKVTAGGGLYKVRRGRGRERGRS